MIQSSSYVRIKEQHYNVLTRTWFCCVSTCLTVVVFLTALVVGIQVKREATSMALFRVSRNLWTLLVKSVDDVSSEVYIYRVWYSQAKSSTVWSMGCSLLSCSCSCRSLWGLPILPHKCCCH